MLRPRFASLALVVVIAGCNSPSPNGAASSGSSSSSAMQHGAMEGTHGAQDGMHGMHGHHGDVPAADASNAGSQSDVDLALHRVAAVHGDAGPWAVAGYRMGKYALTKLELSSYSFDLDIVHAGPKLPQYACVADGASAATGASIGKLNLSLVEADEQHVATTYRRKSTGATVTLMPSASFVARFKDVPREGLREAGRQVMSLPDVDVFDEAH